MLHEDQFHEQLPMFVSAREVKEHYIPGDSPGDLPGSPGAEHLWDRKLRMSQRRDLYGSVEKEGVKDPVWAGIAPSGERVLWEGHHRTSSQFDANPERLMPILYGRAQERYTGEPVTAPTTTSSKVKHFMEQLRGINNPEDDSLAPSPSEMTRYYTELGHGSSS